MRSVLQNCGHATIRKPGRQLVDSGSLSAAKLTTTGEERCGTEARPVGRLSLRISLALTVAVVLLAVAGGIAPELLPGSLFGEDAPCTAAAGIFVTSYIALAFGRIPGLAIDRAGVALVGASLMVLCGALPLEDAYKAVDLGTLALL